MLTLYEGMGGSSLFAKPELTEEDPLTLMHAYVCVHNGVVSREVFIELIKEKFMQAINADVTSFIENIGKLGDLVLNPNQQARWH